MLLRIVVSNLHHRSRYRPYSIVLYSIESFYHRSPLSLVYGSFIFSVFLSLINIMAAVREKFSRSKCGIRQLNS